MKHLLLLLVICSLISCTQLEDKDKGRTQFFPRTELKVKNLPSKENTWVFILAGQSNMAGRGQVEPSDTIPAERILTINKKNELIIAKEPLHFYEPSLTGLDCGLSFGKTLLAQVPDSICILLLPTAVGGSSSSQWLDDSTHRKVKLLTNFKEKVALGKNVGQVKAILWHQGESDANPKDLLLYQSRLTDLFHTFREILGDEKLPILIGELGSFSKDKAYWQQINAQIQKYAATDSNSSVIKTADLNHKGDSVYFNAAGQRLLGERFSRDYLQLSK